MPFIFFQSVIHYIHIKKTSMPCLCWVRILLAGPFDNGFKVVEFHLIVEFDMGIMAKSPQDAAANPPGMDQIIGGYLDFYCFPSEPGYHWCFWRYFFKMASGGFINTLCFWMML